MSHKDYTKFSVKPEKSDAAEIINNSNKDSLEVNANPDNANVITNEITEDLSVLNDVPGVTVIQEDSANEPIVELETCEGFVDNCERLNVRKGASMDDAVITVLEKGSKVNIDVKNSTNEFYKISIDGVDGYCMKKFISSPNLKD